MYNKMYTSYISLFTFFMHAFKKNRYIAFHTLTSHKLLRLQNKAQPSPIEITVQPTIKMFCRIIFDISYFKLLWTEWPMTTDLHNNSRLYPVFEHEHASTFFLVKCHYCFDNYSIHTYMIRYLLCILHWNPDIVIFIYISFGKHQQDSS